MIHLLQLVQIMRQKILKKLSVALSSSMVMWHLEKVMAWYLDTGQLPISVTTVFALYTWYTLWVYIKCSTCICIHFGIHHWSIRGWLIYQWDYVRKKSSLIDQSASNSRMDQWWIPNTLIPSGLPHRVFLLSWPQILYKPLYSVRYARWHPYDPENPPFKYLTGMWVFFPCPLSIYMHSNFSNFFARIWHWSSTIKAENFALDDGFF